MGSRSSCEQADPPSHSVPAFDAALTKATIGRADAYINDKFRLEFLDCDCCCDTTKKVANCDFEGNRVLQDLYEMVCDAVRGCRFSHFQCSALQKAH